MTVSADFHIDTSGPLFDGETKREVDRWLEAAVREAGDQAVNDIHARLGQVLQNPTGFYESHIVTDLQVNDLAITDGGVVYGPWLEGVSSRNTQTRFKGYSTFRRVKNDLDDRLTDIAEDLLKRVYLGRMQ